ncbi:hypothetical protein EAO70_06025 [Streptomyces sp. adm13(2018)]|uniref:hypothetical protein n=1 Tax=Streptomyces sp. adm13(2018) TaxID=2479007 RepID=UPI0011CDF5C1|nr:hypothetical protein [Streptomyces sp. adm13(2018)]TXS22416.1 hypothetical protein EAO70_06025 [Streptomyces sp. adm13(2018)]
MRIAVSLLIALGLGLVGVHLAPVLAQAADITESQAGLIFGVVITWAGFQIAAMLPGAEPTPGRQD